MLGERGYTTGGVVSAYALRRETGIAQGFDFFDSDFSSGSPELAAGQLGRDGAESEAIAERWLERQRSSRVFLFLHLNEPHKPYAPPPQYAEYSPYDGEIAYADEIVGRFVRFLKSHQLYDSSTIVLLSDHGEGLADHGEQEHGLFLYDETIRVPLIVKLSAGAASGRRIRDVVQHIDIVPTILDLAKAPISGDLRGRSLRALLDGTGSLPEQPVYSETLHARYRFGWSELTSVTLGSHRYIKAPMEELYNLERDPHEQQNIVTDGGERAASLRRALDGFAAGKAAQAAPVVLDADREHFEALGYDGAHMDWAAVLVDDPPDPKDRVRVFEAYRESAELISRERLGAAIEVLKRTAYDNPTLPDAWRELAHAQLRAGRLEQAARSYERSAALTPDSPKALVAAAALFLKLGRLDEAQRDAEMTLASIPSDPLAASAEEVLAKIAIARKDFDAAREHAANAQRADPAVPRAVFIEGLVSFAHGRHEEALEHLREADAALAMGALQLTDLHFYTGDALGRLDRWEEAIVEFNREVALFPRNLKVRVSLAMAYRAAGQSEDVERVLSELTTIAPTPEGYSLAARAWTALGEPRRAEALQAEGRRLFRGDPTIKLLAQK
jgi:tetratricopeptide (TPR) repeat protein